MDFQVIQPNHYILIWKIKLYKPNNDVDLQP
jgi:hypothetical protein